MAVAASAESSDTVWFIKVKEVDCICLKDNVDDYGHVIPTGVTYIKGKFLKAMVQFRKCNNDRNSLSCGGKRTSTYLGKNLKKNPSLLSYLSKKVHTLQL